MWETVCLLEGREAASSDEPDRLGATALDGRMSDLSFHAHHHLLWPNARHSCWSVLLLASFPCRVPPSPPGRFVDGGFNSSSDQ